MPETNLLGTLLGDLLAEQHGPEVRERVETIRRAAIHGRDEGGPGELEALLADLARRAREDMLSDLAALRPVIGADRLLLGGRLAQEGIEAAA